MVTLFSITKILEMKSLLSDEIVEDYLRAIELSVERGGPTEFWPFGPGQVDSYFIDLLAIDIFEKFKQDPNKFKKSLHSLGVGVLRWFLLPFVVLGLKLANKYEGYSAKPEEIINFIAVTKQVLESKVRSDPFCLDEKNVILSCEGIKTLVKGLHWFKGSSRKTASFLSMDLESFVWTINFDIFAYSVYWHGPYQLSANETVLIKSFYDLDTEIWSQDKYHSVDIIYLFNKKIGVTIDFMNHMAYSTEIWDKLDKFAVVVDGKMVKNLGFVSELSRYFSRQRKEQLQRISKLTPEEIIIKGTEVYYYMFRDFFSFYGEKWQPPKEFFGRLEKWKLKYWHKFKSRSTNEKKLAGVFNRRLYDPRTTFTD